MLDTLVEYIEKNTKSGTSFAKASYTKEQLAESILNITKQMIIADGKVVGEELDAARDVIQSPPASKNIEDTSKASTFEKNELEKLKRIPLFNLFLIVRDSLDKADILELRECLVNLANSDGEFHSNEQKFIEFFDLVTQSE